MCGRFYLIDLSSFAKWFDISLPGSINPRYNIAPSQDILAIINNGGYKVVNFRWGLTPCWAKDNRIFLINARAETINEKPSFRQSLRKRRCLIPASGFYEWKKEKGGKSPYKISHISKETFAFAGIWDNWVSPEGEEIHSCAIITTSANTAIRHIHNRMPVILSDKYRETWLDHDTEIPVLKSLLNPYPSNLIETTEISKMVNNARNDNPDVLKPINKPYDSPSFQ